MSNSDGTAIYIHCQDFSITCPNCGVEIPEIAIHRVWQPMLQCEECFEEFELTISAERS